MKKFIFILTLSIFAVSCSDNDEPQTMSDTIIPANQIELTVEESTARDALNKFELNLIEKVCEAHPDENVVISPISVSMLLTTLSNSEFGNLNKEITEFLAIDNIDALNSYIVKLTESIPAIDPKANINFANSFWYNETFGLEFRVPDNIAQQFSLESFAFDSNINALQEKMDNWIADKTNNLITSTPIENLEYVLAAYINTLYFKGEWAKKFMKGSHKEFFTCQSGYKSEVYMLRNAEWYPSAINEYCKAVKCDFWNGAFSAYFVLPHNNDLFKDAITHFDELEFNRQNQIEIPEFFLSQSKNEITEILYSLGLKCFAPQYDLNRALRSHYSATVSFDENGAEGSAATSGHDEMIAFFDYVIFNRPFYYFIKENSTRATLIAGKVISL